MIYLLSIIFKYCMCTLYVSVFTDNTYKLLSCVQIIACGLQTRVNNQQLEKYICTYIVHTKIDCSFFI